MTASLEVENLSTQIRLTRSTVHAVGNVDCFLVLGTVRLRPHIEAMRTNLAKALRVEPEQVSVKARSNDGLGLEGEGRACGAWVSVLLYRPV